MEGKSDALQRLLKMGVQNLEADAMERLKEGQINPLSTDDRKFLDDVLREAMISDLDRMKAALMVLRMPYNDGQNPDSANTATSEEKVAAAETILDCAENLDNARDLFKINAWGLILDLLGDETNGVRLNIAEVIAMAVQNDEPSQEKATESMTVERLIDAYNAEKDGGVKGKIFAGLASLVKNYKPAFSRFVKMNGFEVLVDALTEGNMRLKRKSSFLCKNLFEHHEEAAVWASNQRFLNLLGTFLDHEDDVLREHAIRAALSLLRKSAAAVHAAKRAKPEWKAISKSRQKLLKGPQHPDDKENAEEELKLWKEIAKICKF